MVLTKRDREGGKSVKMLRHIKNMKTNKYTKTIKYLIYKQHNQDRGAQDDEKLNLITIILNYCFRLFSK